MVFDDEEQREEIADVSEIKRLLKEIEDSAIGFENYKQHVDRIKSSDKVMRSQVQNLRREYGEYFKKNKELMDRDSYRQMLDEGYIPKDVHDNEIMMKKITLEVISWRTLQQEMYSMIFTKIYRVLDDARALEIKRDALKEMREMDSARNKFHLQQTQEAMNTTKELVGNQLNNFNEKFINLVIMMDEEQRKAQKEMYDFFKFVVEKTNVLKEEKREILSKFSNEYKPKSERLFGSDEENDLWGRTRKAISKPKDDEMGFGGLGEDEVCQDDGNDDIDASFEDMEEDDLKPKRGRPKK